MITKIREPRPAFISGIKDALSGVHKEMGEHENCGQFEEYEDGHAAALSGYRVQRFDGTVVFDGKNLFE